VVATPHIGGLTQAAIEGQALETVEQVKSLTRGQAPTGSVNAESATKLSRLVAVAG
jgi:D-3-phosphoglycerate dehydrogenase / 2-oxoglutarate reductase